MATVAEIVKTVQVDPFSINPATYRCRSISPVELVEMLQRELIDHLTKYGLRVAQTSTPDFRIVGHFREVDEGNQFLRYLLPFLAGASRVCIEGTILVDGETEKPFHYVTRSRVGLLGGFGPVKLAVRRAALFISGDVAAEAGLGVERNSRFVGRYFLGMSMVSLIVATIFAVISYKWASGLPRTVNAIKTEGIPSWTAIMGIGLFVGLALLGVAVAPIRVLKDRSMLWLVAISGLKSHIGVRILFIIFAAAVLVLVGLLFRSAAGSSPQ